MSTNTKGTTEDDRSRELDLRQAPCRPGLGLVTSSGRARVGGVAAGAIVSGVESPRRATSSALQCLLLMLCCTHGRRATFYMQPHGDSSEPPRHSLAPQGGAQATRPILVSSINLSASRQPSPPCLPCLDGRSMADSAKPSSALGSQAGSFSRAQSDPSSVVEGAGDSRNLLHAARPSQHRPRTIQYSECAGLQAQAVIGWFRPIVFLPMRVHDRPLGRADYSRSSRTSWPTSSASIPFVNVFQVCVETLLFYHPAVWCLDERIRAERDTAADTRPDSLGNAWICAVPLT